MFVAKRSQAQWKTIYDFLATMKIGDVVTYKQMEGLLPDVPYTSVRPAFYQAMKKMQENRQRTFAVVRGVGYRMVEANEHEKLARVKHKSAKRVLSKAQRIVSSADRSRLTQDERRRLDELEHHLARHADMLKRLDDRTAKTERLVEATDKRLAFAEKDQARLSDRVERMEALLRQHDMLPD